jgi:3-phytase
MRAMRFRPAAICGLVAIAMLQVSACARRDDSPATAATATAAPASATAASAASAATAGSAVRPADGPVLKPVAETEPVPHDADDPAIWVHPTDPSRSLILGTDKFAREGGLHVFGLDGKRRQTIAPLDRPNNVDIEYGVTLGGLAPGDVKATNIDIAVLTERKQHRLRIFAIPADGGTLVDLAPDGLPVLEGQTGEASEPMGVSLYKRPADGVTFAIVAPKTGGTTDYLWQYRLERKSPGERITATLVRRFGNFSRRGAEPGEIGEIEAVVVDDELGYVYYSDERFGIRKWHANPDHADAARELAVFGTEGYAGDREGLAIYAPRQTPYSNRGGPSGLLISSDQVEGATRLFLYPREGTIGNPHNHPAISVRQTSSDETDGLDVTARSLPGYPRGLLVMMNSTGRNFSIYRWDDLVPLVGGARP